MITFSNVMHKRIYWLSDRTPKILKGLKLCKVLWQSHNLSVFNWSLTNPHATAGNTPVLRNLLVSIHV